MWGRTKKAKGLKMPTLKTYIASVKYKNGENGPFTSIWSVQANNAANAKKAAEKEAESLNGTVLKITVRKRDS